MSKPHANTKLPINPLHPAMQAILEQSMHRSVSRRWRCWRKLGAPKTVVSWIRKGYRLPFKSHPSGWVRPNPPPASEEERAARPKMWASMIATGKMAFHLPPEATPRFVSPVRGEPKYTEGVLQQDFRIIQDLRDLNEHLQERPVRYETAAHIPLLAGKHDTSTCVDFSKFFYSFPLAKEDQKYTCCRAPEQPHPDTVGVNEAGHPVDQDGRLTYVPNGYYTMQCMPMGCSLSPYLVQKCTRWIVGLIRRRGSQVVWYVDDVLLLAHPSRIRPLTTWFVTLVERLGLMLNPTKGWRAGRRRFIFLGIEVDLDGRAFHIPGYKMDALRQQCKLTLLHARSHSHRVPRRALAKLAGTAVSLMLASPLMPLWLRSLHDAVASGSSWNSSVHLSVQAIMDIRTIASLAVLYQSAPFKPPRTHATIVTDASIRGYGGWGTCPHHALQDMAGMWEEQHTSGEINRLELQAVLLYLRANRSQLHGLPILLRSDNSTVIAVCNKHSSRSGEIMGTYRQLYTELQLNCNTLTAVHITTKDNWRADDLSRTKDPTDFSYHPSLRHQAEDRWAVRCQMDRFASVACHQDLPYDTRYACDQASTVDTFSTRWDGMAWLTPPLSLLHSVLEKVEADQAPGLIVCPEWPAATWFPLLQRLAVDSYPINIADAVVRHTNNPAQPEVLRNKLWRFRVWLLIG